MPKTEFVSEPSEDGVRVCLLEKRLLRADRPVPVDRWAEVADERTAGGVARALRMLEEAGDAPAPAARDDGDSLLIAHAAAAALEEHQARSLGMPPAVPYVLGVQTRGTIAQPGFRIDAGWQLTGSRPASGASVLGCILKRRDEVYRVPEPLFSIWHAIAELKDVAPDDEGERFRLLARLRQLLPDGGHPERLDLDPYLRNTRIVHAAAFSLRLRTDRTGFQFDPVLFGRHVRQRWEESDHSAAVSEAESLLPEAKQETFARERFTRWDDCRDRYGLGDHYYVYVDPGLQRALTTVRRAQKADGETRRRFARNPQLYLKDALLSDGADMAEADVEGLFIPTEQYSERIVDLGIWQPTVLPWLKPQPNTWLPERFGIAVGDERIEIAPEDVEAARHAVAEAINRGAESVEISGRSVPATPETLGALDRLMGLAKPLSDPAAEEEPTADDASPEAPEEAPEEQGKKFLIVGENYEQVSYRKAAARRADPSIASVPLALVSTLKPHQEEGLDWLEKAWCAGAPGALLADDMGLGKTITALAFLCWLQEARGRLGLPRLPILVVAPTGLLSNWGDEHALHLAEPGLGEACLAFGRHLGALRVDDRRRAGRDVDLGVPVLDAERLRAANWVLTTYETLRDYHHSFAAVPFAAAVYDEMQKVKNPTSQLSRAAKTVNADFTVGLTGTPIENRIEDLWGIMDIVYPGYLGDMKTFSATFGPNDIDALKRLHAAMMEPVDGAPAVMCRRMKSDHLKGLPEKRVFRHRETMPASQATAYADAVARARDGGAGSMLETLHRLRGISLHPIDPQQGHGVPHAEYLALSARLAKTFEQLRRVADAREKALIFVESLDMQDLLALMIKKEFGMPRLPMIINGDVAGHKRQEHVRAFQKERGRFDVMILSPKAGGVGLTLTAANHVIHLSRWWNPAVEDQCTDRIYRIGQDKPVHVHYPMAIHPDPQLSDYSFDLKLDALLERKRTLSRDVLVPPVIPDQDEAGLFRDTVPDAAPAGSARASLADLDCMDDKQFELWVLRQMLDAGWRANRTPTSHDGGADGVLHAPGGVGTAIVQAKHRQGDTCDDEPIDDLLRARTAYGKPDARLVAVTSATEFTPRARDRAAQHGIVLVRRPQLQHWPVGCL